MKTLKLIVTSLLIILSSSRLYAATFECIGQQSKNYYDFEIVDVGDEEGIVTVNNGGAPVDFRATYRETYNKKHIFEFGYENFNDGITKGVSFAEITISHNNFATGKIEYYEHDYDSQRDQLIREKLSCKL
ncbi:MAG: hypothetical protein A2451_02580 [Bdellovibrionales bacterium RIFOXYC2_FULL_39_8]|nr:MAG: hypothetical protein A2404_07975 [Bdellovibrionales bacterium RIFOXYC1_FULL_39_130]OFZ73930.1 MAG: hypothetical protein A2451_02580 [Bdellovibrionales bacterium RIFOXYC2_FULL_39_8]